MNVTILQQRMVLAIVCVPVYEENTGYGFHTRLHKQKRTIEE